MQREMQKVKDKIKEEKEKLDNAKKINKRYEHIKSKVNLIVNTDNYDTARNTNTVASRVSPSFSKNEKDFRFSNTLTATPKTSRSIFKFNSSNNVCNYQKTITNIRHNAKLKTINIATVPKIVVTKNSNKKFQEDCVNIKDPKISKISKNIIDLTESLDILPLISKRFKISPPKTSKIRSHNSKEKQVNSYFKTNDFYYN